MDSGHIFTIVFGQATGIGLLLAPSSRKRGGQKKIEELCQHIQGIRIKASVPEKDTNQEKVGETLLGAEGVRNSQADP